MKRKALKAALEDAETEIYQNGLHEKVQELIYEHFYHCIMEALMDDYLDNGLEFSHQDVIDLTQKVADNTDIQIDYQKVLYKRKKRK